MACAGFRLEKPLLRKSAELHSTAHTEKNTAILSSLQRALIQWNSLLWQGSATDEFPEIDQKWIDWLRKQGLQQWQHLWLTPPHPPISPSSPNTYQHNSHIPHPENTPLAILTLHTTQQDISASKQTLLLVPPPSHKASIFDITQNESLVNHLKNQGHHVISLNWNDQHATPPHWNDYRQALHQIIQKLSTESSSSLHVMGLCLGGVLLIDALSHPTHRPLHAIQSLILLSSSLDYRCINPLSCFTWSPIHTTLQHNLKWMQWIPAPIIHSTCSALLPTPFTITPSPLRAWSQDGLNVSAPFALELLEAFYHKNSLLDVNNGQTALRNFDIPVYIVNGLNDKLIPIHSVFNGLHHFPLKHPIRLALSDTGHLRCFLPKDNTHQTFFGNWQGESKNKWMHQNSHSSSQHWLDDWNIWRFQIPNTTD
jgi:poly(3-hydroxyalkanoate) synthetase